MNSTARRFESSPKATEYILLHMMVLYVCKALYKITLRSQHTVSFQVEVFWIVTPCSVAVRYQRLGGPCCFHLQGKVKMEAARSPESLASYRNTTRRQNPETST